MSARGLGRSGALPWLIALISACGALGLPGRDGGSAPPDGGRSSASDAGGSGGGTGGGTTGGGTGGGGDDFDAGWPATALPVDAFVETVLPGFRSSNESLVIWQGRLFYGDGTQLLEADGAAWRTVSSGASADLMALRSTEEGPLLVTRDKAQLLCDQACRSGAAPRVVDLPFGVFLDRVCGGSGPVAVRDLHGEYYELVDGGWPSIGDPGSQLEPGPCYRLRDRTVLTTDNYRVGRLSPDGGFHFETAMGRYLPVVDFAETGFGLVAVAGYDNELISEAGGRWASLATPGERDWVRGFALPDGGLIVVGTKGLALASAGSIRTWRYPRGTLDTRREAIAMSPDGTVWVVAKFTNELGDPLNLVVGYRLR